jgi:short-subunit dehydrogenase
MGVIRGCHRFLPLFRQQEFGYLVNVSSLAGLLPVPELSAYSTAKAGVVALSEQLRVDLHGSPVGISLLCPAFVQTRLMETFRSHDPRHRKQADRWMAGSKVSAAEVAEQVYTAVTDKRFLVLSHDQSRWALRFKRWFPGLFYRSVVKAASRLAQKGTA